VVGGDTSARVKCSLGSTVGSCVVKYWRTRPKMFRGVRIIRDKREGSDDGSAAGGSAVFDGSGGGGWNSGGGKLGAV